MMMRTSIAGTTVRLRLSNSHGGAPILIASTSLALRADDKAGVDETSLRKLTFGGEASITIGAPSRP